MRILLKAQTVRTAAARHGETIKDLGLRAGIHPSHLSRSLANTHELSARKRRALLLALGLEFDELFEIVARDVRGRREPTDGAGPQ